MGTARAQHEHSIMSRALDVLTEAALHSRNACILWWDVYRCMCPRHVSEAHGVTSRRRITCVTCWWLVTLSAHQQRTTTAHNNCID
jgi:hypothetical protein